MKTTLKHIMILILASVLTAGIAAADEHGKNQVPSNTFFTDEETTIKLNEIKSVPEKKAGIKNTVSRNRIPENTFFGGNIPDDMFDSSPKTAESAPSPKLGPISKNHGNTFFSGTELSLLEEMRKNGTFKLSQLRMKDE